MKTILSLLILSLLPLLSLAQKVDPWQVAATDIDASNYYGVTVANGMLGIVSAPEPFRVSEVVLNGAFDRYGRGRVSNIMKGFDFLNMYLNIDQQRVSSSNIQNYQQTLDMYRATLSTSFDMSDKASVRYQMMALRHLPYTAMVEVVVTAKADIEIEAASVLSAPDMLRDVQQFYAQIDRPHVQIPLMTSVAQSPTGRHTVAASNTFLFDEPHGEEPHLIHEDWDYNAHWLKFRKKIKKGESYRYYIIGTMISTAHVPDPQNEAERLTIYAALERAERLVTRHEQEWATLWESDITIEGDPQAQRDIHFALYHLYSFARAGQAYSLSPMGLSGLGYNGHVFWDTELWMYPPLLLLQPEIARSLLEYRFERLDAAKQNAFSHGYKGAMFPWESDDVGMEATPVWALTGPFEQHISGCIGWAFYKYYQVTGDKAWLRDRGYPLLKEVADFWVSRVEPGDDGLLHIRNVVGADEWAENIDDNAFTNGVAITALRYAAQAARELGITPDPAWEKTADGIPILQFEDGTTREHATYQGEEIKQADVNLLSYPLSIITDEETIKKDIAYYESRMSPTGPAMGPSVFSVLYNRLGDSAKAYELFVRGYKPNEVPPFGVMAETAGGTNPYFATGAGGMLQAVLAGFGGLEITDQGVQQVPSVLPKKWKSITITGIGPEKRTFTVK